MWNVPTLWPLNHGSDNLFNFTTTINKMRPNFNFISNIILNSLSQHITYPRCHVDKTFVDCERNLKMKFFITIIFVRLMSILSTSLHRIPGSDHPFEGQIGMQDSGFINILWFRNFSRKSKMEYFFSERIFKY